MEAFASIHRLKKQPVAQYKSSPIPRENCRNGHTAFQKNAQIVQKETALMSLKWINHRQYDRTESHEGQILTPHCQTSRLRFISIFNIYYSNIIFNIQTVTTKLLPREVAQTNIRLSVFKYALWCSFYNNNCHKCAVIKTNDPPVHTHATVNT